jgi:alpha-mannosidase
MKSALAAVKTLVAIFVVVGAAGVSAVTIEEPIAGNAIRATASSTFSPQQDCRHLLDGAGLSGDRHDEDAGARTMWHTVENPAPSGIPAAPAWVRFDFASPRSIAAVRIWNHNQAGLTNRGFRKARVLTSTDGATWTTQAIELNRGTGLSQRFPLVVQTPVISVIIAGDSNYGGNCYGLSAVHFLARREVAEKDLPFPAGMEVKPQPYYGHRKDGKPGRALKLIVTGARLYGDVLVETMGETTRFASLQGESELTVLLPDDAGVTKACAAKIALRRGQRALSQTVTVAPMRHWTVFIYPHSHVDIGYTNTQDNVEFIHKRNLVEGLKLARATAGYPKDARYLWNNEVTWPVERYLHEATAAQRDEMLRAIRAGYIHLAAGYINDNTSVAADEEFEGFFAPAKKLEQATGVKVDTMVQVDVPGMSWGIVPAAQQAGVRYILALNNGSDRVGHSMEISHRPFWWIGPDGKSKVLFLQPGSYAVCAQLKGIHFWPAMMGQTDRSKLFPIVKTGNPRENFIDGYLWPTLARLEGEERYPYDILPVSWAIADNMPIDADLPDAVRSWNEEYAFPHLVIASAHQIMSAYEAKYGDSIPSYRGDFTEYWTDGIGSAAKQMGMNRTAKERLIQADTLWTMLHAGQGAPRAAFDEAWRNVVLGSEHTWCFADPGRQPITNDILRVKFSYFQAAEDGSKTLLAQALSPAAAANDRTIEVFNTLSWPRSGVVVLPASAAQRGDGVVDEQGRAVAAQRLATGELAFLASDVPALGGRAFHLAAAAAAKPAVIAHDTTLGNGLVHVTLDPHSGDITSLTDQAGYEYASRDAACALNSYRYLPGSAAPAAATRRRNVKITTLENGPLVASLLVESQADGGRSLRSEIRVIAGQPQVEIDNVLDKLAIRAKEGTHFGFAFNIPDPVTRADIPWGVMELEKDQLPPANRNWLCFQRWLDISNRERGVTWCSLDVPLFESGDMTANVQGPATNSPVWLRRLQSSATIYSWATNNHWYTNFPLSQEGKLRFRYRILPHKGAYDAAAANRFGMEQAQPLVAAVVKEPLQVTPPVAVDNPRVFVSVLRTSADGTAVTLRLRSLSDHREAVTLAWPAGVPKSLLRCAAEETTPLPPPAAISLGPYSVITLRAAHSANGAQPR